ncbi:MAG: discoidin domain-containing protein, partial [Chthoniobacterales bacterium]
ATATSVENAGGLATNANDGNLGTRWSSGFIAAGFPDPQSITINLGQSCTIHSVVLTWEAAGGKDYTIEASTDGTNFNIPIATVTGNTVTGTANPLTYAAPGGAVTAQWVRVTGNVRILPAYGYSLWEFAIMGTTGSGGSAPVINSALTKSGTVGTALTYNITATNTPTSYGATALAGTGLSINTTTGAITGTPTTAGTINSSITATNASGTDTKTLVITISAAGSPPVINSSLTASATVGTAFTYNITATNTPTSYGATALTGTGLSINTTTGAITGTPTAAGTINSSISATNASGTDTKTLVITVNAAGDTNVALNRTTVTASSFEAGNIVTNGNDASTTSRWAAANGTFPQWWKVDLGSVKTISAMNFMWYAPTTRAYKFKVEVSNDDVNYTLVVDKTTNTVNGYSPGAVSTSGRYVMITVTGSSNGGFASAYDFAILGH